MNSDDRTIRVLVEIRDGVRSLTDRVEHVESDLGTLGRQVVESELRTATAITDLHGTMRDIHGLLRSQLDLRDRVERCERDIDDLKKRVN